MLESLRTTAPQEVQLLRSLSPQASLRNVPVENFEIFLPPPGTEVGGTWSLPEAQAFKYLEQLHPKVRHQLNIDGSGAYAVLQATSDDRVRVRFRLHPQFEVANKVFLSPSQFAGEMIYNTKSKTPEKWELKVPLDHPLNVSIEVHKDNWPVALGTLEKMGLILESGKHSQNVAWDAEISTVEALSVLKKRFYAFDAIPWRPLENAIAESAQSHKPLFAIVIAGALDDQSC